MGLSGYCVLFLFFTFAVALDVRQERRNLRQPVFWRNSDTDKGLRISKRSLPGWLAPTIQHTINRRSADQGDTCEALQGYETKLAANTHSVSYHRRSCNSSPVGAF